MQTPPEHQLPSAQSVSTTQTPTHSAGPQAKAPQACVWAGGQEPVPAQTPWIVATPAVQEAGRQTVEAPG